MKKTLLLALLLGGAAWAEKPAPLPSIHISTPSRANPANQSSYKADNGSALVKAARATPVRRTLLANGLTALVCESPEEDVVAIEVLIRSGALEESSPVSGITNIIMEMLQDRISLTPDGEDRVENAGAILKTSSELDYARVSIVCNSKSFPALLQAVAQSLQPRPVTSVELERARKRILASLSDSNGAMGQIYDIFRQTFYRYHPYRSSGKGSTLAVERLDPKAVEDYLNQFFVPNRIVVSVSGRVDRVAVEEMVRKHFTPLVAHETKQVEIAWEPKSSEKEVSLSGGTSVGWLVVGFPAPAATSRDYMPMKMILSLMGEGLSSRLFTEIREKRSLAYELGAMYPILRGPSHMITYAISKPEQVMAARKQLLKEIDRLKKDGVPTRELEETRRKVLGAYLLERETNQGKAFNLALAEIVGVGYEYDQNMLREIENVTPAQIQDVAQRYLENFTLIVARPGGRFYWDSL